MYAVCLPFGMDTPNGACDAMIDVNLSRLDAFHQARTIRYELAVEPFEKNSVEAGTARYFGQLTDGTSE